MDEKRITQVFLYYREKFGEIDKKISDLHKEKKKLNKDESDRFVLDWYLRSGYKPFNKKSNLLIKKLED